MKFITFDEVMHELSARVLTEVDQADYLRIKKQAEALCDEAAEKLKEFYPDLILRGSILEEVGLGGLAFGVELPDGHPGIPDLEHLDVGGEWN